MAETTWDWESQRADTEETVQQLSNDQGIPAGLPINLDIQTVAGEGAERGAYILALRAAGHPVEIYTGDDGIETVEITIPDTRFDASLIWDHEKAVTEIALAHGYVADGWGFWDAGDA